MMGRDPIHPVVVLEEEIVRSKLLISAVAALILTNLSVDAFAQSNVKVALLEMSATMGMGTVGMMGPGMGMMGQGMMGQGMMGPGMGMMGPGMMGMMALRLNQDNVKAGDVTFDVMNWSRSTVHEMVVVAVSSSSLQLPYDYSQSKVREDQVKIIGETRLRRPRRELPSSSAGA
jgi:hypothetical protein